MSELEWNRGMARYPTSSGPTSRTMVMRLPVVSRRRWVQRTALGAADVPEVNSSTHRESTSGSRPGSPAPAAHGANASSSDSPMVRSPSSASAKRSDTNRPPGRSSAAVTGASSSWWRGSVTSSCTSVWAMSARRCSSRRVWLSPTTTAPMRPAAARVKT